MTMREMVKNTIVLGGGVARLYCCLQIDPGYKVALLKLPAEPVEE